MGHLATQPRGSTEGLTLGGQLDLRNDEPRVVAQELIHLPLRSIMYDYMAVLLDDGPVAEFQHLLRIGDWNLVLEFRACHPLRHALDGEKCLVSRDAYPDGSMLVTIQIALTQPHAVALAPARPFYQELALDFGSHKPSSFRIPLHSTRE